MATSRLISAAAATAVLSLVLAACGGSDDDKSTDQTSPSATPNVELAEGAELTEPGSTLSFGKAATVNYTANEQKKTVLKISVNRVARASIDELSAYALDAPAKASTPYYVNVQITNLGDTDLGRSDVPIYLVDSRDTLIHSSAFTNTFAPCKSRPFPASFAKNATVSACLLYLVPKGATYREISFRPVQDVDPVVWTGKATTSAALAEKTKKKAAR